MIWKAEWSCSHLFHRKGKRMAKGTTADPCDLCPSCAYWQHESRWIHSSTNFYWILSFSDLCIKIDKAPTLPTWHPSHQNWGWEEVTLHWSFHCVFIVSLHPCSLSVEPSSLCLLFLLASNFCSWQPDQYQKKKGSPIHSL